MTDYTNALNALFKGRPTGQTVHARAHGLHPLGDKPAYIEVRYEIPDNAEIDFAGVRVQVEAAFHGIFGREAKHLTPDGEPTGDLNEAIEVWTEGDFDAEAAAETRERIEEIVTEAVAERRQSGLRSLLDNAVRPPDGPDLN